MTREEWKRRPLLPHPTIPGKHIDPETGILPIEEWGSACGRGIVDPKKKKEPRAY